MKVLVLYAHPAQQHSQANKALAEVARQLDNVSFLDLYGTYPRFDIDIEQEQKRLVEHDVVLFQFPMMWYSVPPLLKEWLDLVLEYGFAYGEGGTRLQDKLWLSAITMGAAQSSYGPQGHNRFSLRELLAPLEATARLCHMRFMAPYTLFEALKVSGGENLSTHVAGYQRLLEALRDDRFDANKAGELALMDAENIPTNKERASA